ncbi:MAG TPA: DUF2510 domain-containing protein [Jiangellales bacterium]|nr:DUF2510 domain-containing protein [Jiangellales bacterium]
MTAQRVGPSRAWYWLAGALVVGAVVLAAVGLVLGLTSFDRRIDEMQRVPLPGTGEVTFTDAGRYDLYYEGVGAGEGEVPAFTVSLLPVDGGEPVQIGGDEGTVTYTFGGRSGIRVGSFEIDSPGRYVLEADADGTVVGPAELAVGRGLGRSIAGPLLLALGGALILFLLGVVLALVVALRRRSAPRQPVATGQRVDAAPPAPGWFPDVTHRHELRYWDGRRWTEHVVDAGHRDVDPLAAPDAPR